MAFKKGILTPKQKVFAKLYAKTGNGTQSALQAYETNDPATAQVIASENILKPMVKKEIDKELEAIGITDSYIFDKFKAITDKPIETRVTADQHIRALDKLAILKDLYPVKKTVSAKYSYSEQYNAMDYQGLEKEVRELRELNDEI